MEKRLVAKCSPKVVPRTIQPPIKRLKCFNCGCKVLPGKCHCGAELWWAFDPYDGWYEAGRISQVVIADSADQG